MARVKAIYTVLVDVTRQSWCLIVGHEVRVGWRRDGTTVSAIVRCPRCLAWRPHPWAS